VLTPFEGTETIRVRRRCHFHHCWIRRHPHLRDGACQQWWRWLLPGSEWGKPGIPGTFPGPV